MILLGLALVACQTLAERDDATTLMVPMQGTVTYRSYLDGELACDATIDVLLDPYDGDECEGCDFAFWAEATLEEQRGNDFCTPFPPLALLEGFHYDKDYFDLMVAGIEDEDGDVRPITAFGTYWSYHGYYYSDEEYYPSPTQRVDLVDYGLASFTSTPEELSWSLEAAMETYSLINFITRCECADCVNWSSGPWDGGAGDWVATGSLSDSAPSLLDLWSITASAGDRITVTADTVDDGTALSPEVWVSDANGCILAMGSDQYPCTFPGSGANECSGVKLTLEGEGPYYVLVVAGWARSVSPGSYALRVDAETDPALVQLMDDVSFVAADHIQAEASFAPR